MSHTPKTSRAEALRQVKAFNASCPIGTAGVLRKDNGNAFPTKVRAEAYEMCGQSVAFFEGVSGSYKTDRFTVTGGAL